MRDLKINDKGLKKTDDDRNKLKEEKASYKKRLKERGLTSKNALRKVDLIK